MTDPKGTDTLVYDGLNRLVQVSRSNGVVEDYAFNSMGALSVNAGALLNVQRPRLDGNGLADSAVPATYNALPVTLDGGGRITSLNGASLVYGSRNELRGVTDGVTTETYGFDGFMRRISRTNNQGVNEYYTYEDTTLEFGGHSMGSLAGTIGAGRQPSPLANARAMSTLNAIDSVGPQNIIAVLDSSGGVTSGLLYDGIDHPLRLARSGLRYYYEVDLAGNVRRIRDVNGNDLGGYRYTAFGEEYPADATTPAPSISQPLQWKGRWASSLAGGIYDVRARQWSPGMGAFTAIDEFTFKHEATTLGGWPYQNPSRFRDHRGHDNGPNDGGLPPGGTPTPYCDPTSQCCPPAPPNPGGPPPPPPPPPPGPNGPGCVWPCQPGDPDISCGACCDFYGVEASVCKSACCSPFR
jgi:hypothetical protein